MKNKLALLLMLPMLLFMVFFVGLLIYAAFQQGTIGLVILAPLVFGCFVTGLNMYE